MGPVRRGSASPHTPSSRPAGACRRGSRACPAPRRALLVSWTGPRGPRGGRGGRGSDSSPEEVPGMEQAEEAIERMLSSLETGQGMTRWM